MSNEGVPMAQEGFYCGDENSEWYRNLKRDGSCLTLLRLLQANRSLIHELGHDGITALHKGVEHGCVALVRFILVDLFDDDYRGLCTCSEHGTNSVAVSIEELLSQKNTHGSTAVNIAVVSGSPKMVALLSWALVWVHEDDHFYAQAPDVKDEDVHILDEKRIPMVKKVISIIEGILADPGEDIDTEYVDMLKGKCEGDVDFEFVPVAHVFLHFLLRMYSSMNHNERRKIEKIVEKVVAACMNTDDGMNEGESDALLKTLFNMLDPRGRTILHATVDHTDNFRVEQLIGMVKPEIRNECINARDGAGRTVYLSLLAQNKLALVTGKNRLDVKLSPLVVQREHMIMLKVWYFPYHRAIDDHSLSMVQYAILFNSTHLLNVFYPLNSSSDLPQGLYPIDGAALQLAAMLGKTKSLEHILKHHTKFNSSEDAGLGKRSRFEELPAIHCAALFGQVEAIRTILKFPVYDPFVETKKHGTALHLLLNIDNSLRKSKYEYVQNILLLNFLPTSTAYNRLKNEISKLKFDKDIEPKMYSANEISCINLLLQAGIDIWTPSVWTKELPSPGPMANDEARKWWYEKLVREVVTLKTSVNGAANATSVIAALVATASFIGPFQPPLGYGDLNGHYIQTDRSPMRVYLVCNILSFFFSIASILMAVLPAIPMPKESLYDELLRSQRCLKGAALMLLISIICILISFSSASLAVVASGWHERQLVVVCIIVGGMVCVGVLVIYIIRLLRMFFHRNEWFRRTFSKHMYF